MSVIKTADTPSFYNLSDEQVILICFWITCVLYIYALLCNLILQCNHIHIIMKCILQEFHN